MKLLFDSLWRAMAYGLRPGVVLRALMPLLMGMALMTALGYWFWQGAVDQVRWWLSVFPYTEHILVWLDTIGSPQLKDVLAPLLVAIAVTPFMLVLALLAVAQLLTPGLVRLVAVRRFMALQAQPVRASLMTVLWSIGSCLLALLALLTTIPLWAVPPLWLVLPPLILGWLSLRVLSFAALVHHASREERVLILRQHRLRLLLIGVVSGYLAMLPCLVWVWAGGPRYASAFIILAPVAMAIYVLLFAFSSLWFTHYCLAALRHMRTALHGLPVAKESP